MVGIVNPLLRRSIPNKKWRTTFKMTYDKKIITNPTIAAMIESRAASILDLSPPEVTHRIPPIIKKSNAIIAAIIKRKEIRLPIAVPIGRLQRVDPIPFGQKEPVLFPAKAD